MRRREVTVRQSMREGQGSPSARAICIGMRRDYEVCGSFSGGLRSVATGADDEQGQTKILRLHDAQRDGAQPPLAATSVANSTELFYKSNGAPPRRPAVGWSDWLGLIRQQLLPQL